MSSDQEFRGCPPCHGLWRSALALSFLLAAQGLLQAQAIRRVVVRVTAVSGGNVYINQGREAGLRIGDPLRLYPPGQSMIQATIKAVSRSNARAEFPAGTAFPGVGVRGEILVPEERFQKPERSKSETRKPEPRRQVPEHPPWQNPLKKEDQDPEKPLLAPAFGQGPAARPTRIHGRIYVNLLNTWDRGTANNRYLLARSGTDLRVENPLHLGGSLHFRGDLSRRETHLAGQVGETRNRGRLDRASYRWGDVPDAPFRTELGRFLQPFAEFGLLDGAAADIPTGKFNRTGISLGVMPEPFDYSASGDDFQTALYHRYSSGEDEDLVMGLGYQKTWYRGSSDRDLVIGNMDYRPLRGLFVHSALWMDYYTNGDQIKSGGFEITEFHLQSTYSHQSGHGVGLFYSHLRWPELLRAEFALLTPDQVRNNRISRVGINTWHQLHEKVRFDARWDHWDDQDTDGNSWDLRTAVRDFFYERGEVTLSSFRNDGAFTSGSGYRLSLSKYFDRVFADLSYEWSEYDNQQATGLGGKLQQQALFLNTNFNVGRFLDLTMNLDYRFGDSQDTFTVGLFAQTRF